MLLFIDSDIYRYLSLSRDERQFATFTNKLAQFAIFEKISNILNIYVYISVL